MISVIVPVYKVEPYIHQCVDSILKQTYKDLEIILIDDGSPDRCGDICDEYERKDKRVRVFHTENRGLSAARNLGLREATGEYIGFVDSDDWIEPEMYEVLLRRLEETGADVSVCGMWYEYADKSIKLACSEAVYDPCQAIRALILGEITNHVMNKLWTRKTALILQFPEGRVYEDIFTVYKMFLWSERIVTVSRVMYRYKQRKGSIARTYPMQNLIDYWDAIYERYEFLRTNCKEIVENKIELELRKQCAIAIARTWRWFYSVPRKMRDYQVHYFTVS